LMRDLVAHGIKETAKHKRKKTGSMMRSRRTYENLKGGGGGWGCIEKRRRFIESKALKTRNHVAERI